MSRSRLPPAVIALGEMRGSHGGFIRIEQGNADDIVMVMQAFLGKCK